VDKVPHGHWKTTTLIAALGQGGMRCSTTVDGAVNREVFEAFVQQVLIGSLHAGDIVVMDNLSSHKGSRVRQLIESVGATVLYLPPYSPDLNPIELAFAKLKQLMRSVGRVNLRPGVPRLNNRFQAAEAAEWDVDVFRRHSASVKIGHSLLLRVFCLVLSVA